MKDLYEYFYEKSRPFTKEEYVLYNDSINKIFEPTGRNLFEQDIKPLIIENWEQLKECESDTHTLEIELFYGCGWIRSNKEGGKDYYLSTHTFYESTYKHSTKLLQECGFNVELVSWG